MCFDRLVAASLAVAATLAFTSPANAFSSAVGRSVRDGFDSHHRDEADRAPPERVPNWEGPKGGKDRQSQQGLGGLSPGFKPGMQERNNCCTDDQSLIAQPELQVAAARAEGRRSSQARSGPRSDRNGFGRGPRGTYLDPSIILAGMGAGSHSSGAGDPGRGENNSETGPGSRSNSESQGPEYNSKGSRDPGRPSRDRTGGNRGSGGWGSKDAKTT